MSTQVEPTLGPGATGSRVEELKRALATWFARHPPAPRLHFTASPGYGPAVVEAVRVFQRRNALYVDGVAGAQVWGALRATQYRQEPPLPARVHFPADAYARRDTWFGLQPWIAPQVRALAAHFALDVVAGWGGSPPHATRSDHRWGGAVDLGGPAYRLESCNFWADRYAADPYRAGAVFRWVGGPARDSSGAEPGHATHVHLSWFRNGPATSVFDTLEFG